MMPTDLTPERLAELRRLAEAVPYSSKWYTADELSKRRAIAPEDGNYIEAFKPPVGIALLDHIEAVTRERDEARAYVDEQVQERMDEINAEGDAFDKDCINAMRGLLKHECGEAGAELLHDIDGWSADQAATTIAEEINEAWRAYETADKRAEAAKARLAEAEQMAASLKGYLLNAVIDLQTGTAKATTLNTLNGGVKLVDAFLSPKETT